MDAITETRATAIPPVKGGAIAYLQVNGALRAAEFYQRAFGAQTVFAMPPDEHGRTMHVHLLINGSSVMLSDGCGGHAPEQPQGFTLLLTVDDVDAWWKRATDAGAQAVMPVTEMFWGDRYGQVRDPFGVLWGIDEPQRQHP